MKFRIVVRKEGVPDQPRVIDAPSRVAVYDQIQKEGGEVVELVEGGKNLKIPDWLNITFRTGVKRVEIIRMAKNLSAMLSAGLSISRALSVIERQSNNVRLKDIVTSLSESIKQGSSLHEALTAYPKVPLFVAMARAGESRFSRRITHRRRSPDGTF